MKELSSQEKQTFEEGKTLDEIYKDDKGALRIIAHSRMCGETEQAIYNHMKAFW